MNTIWGISGSSVKCSSYLHKATFGTGDCLKSCLFFFPLLFYWPVPSDNSTYNGLIHLITFFCSCSAMQNQQAGLLLPRCKPWLNNRGWKREWQIRELPEQTRKHELISEELLKESDCKRKSSLHFEASCSYLLLEVMLCAGRVSGFLSSSPWESSFFTRI